MFAQFKIILTASLFLQISSNAIARSLPSRTQPRTSSAAIQPPCLMCDWKIAPDVAVASQGDPCEDLLPVSCLNEKGDYKISELSEQIEKKLKNLVREAQAKGAQQLGYKNFDEAMVNIFRKEGFPIKKDISEKAKKYIFENDYANYVDKKEVFEVLAQCDEDRKKLDEIKIFEVNDFLQMGAIAKQVDAFSAKYRAITSELYLKDLPGFLNKINIQCKLYDYSKEEFKTKNLLQHPLAVKLEKVCSQRKELRNKVLELYLKQDDPATKNETFKFVQDNSEILYANVSSIKEPAPASTATGIEAVRALLYDKLNTRYEVCNIVGERFNSAPSEIATATLLSLSTAKATVEYLIDQIYTPERKEIVQKIHQAAKREAFSVAQRLTRNPAKLARIEDHFKRMAFTWFTKPAQDRYKKDRKLGIDVLNINQLDRLDVWTQAFTGNLEFFSSLNAFYLPDTKFGANDKPLSVTMHPMFIEMLDTYPQAFLSVMSHEIGHNIGPEVTKFNNYDLEKEYAPLLQCLGSADSIRMQDIQADEAVADVVAAEVVSKLVSQLPAEKQKASVFAAMQSFCKMAELGDKDLALTLTASHPDSMLRISGIFGGNQSLRKVLSCSAESKRFRTCSVTGAP